jgi:hypothetical protein
VPGKKYASIANPKQYRKLKSLGFSKKSAAKITNAQSGKRKRGKRGK